MDFFIEKLLFPLLLLLVVVVLVFEVQVDYEKAEELQVILKNECGMEYSVHDVIMHGENLSRICGLKKAYVS